MNKKGKIYLIPTTLGDTEINAVIPANVTDIIDNLHYFIVENIRTARRYIRKVSLNKNIDEITFFELNKHTDIKDVASYLNPCISGNSIGVISEAGNPGIADPGANIVKIAHQKKIDVIPLVGPSSILLALISSGMNGQNFAFNGYLPIKDNERIKKIQYLEKKSKSENQSQIFMETPFRNMKMLEAVLQTCRNNTLLCIATDITLQSEFIKTKTIAEWKKQKPQLNKRPTVFVLQA
ncbi:MAG: SAM-dependent methyltransferase [Bacteroidetes bacterium]|nr:MAG: SAM-dependent methyltransferase [Bacteroidota bacterium]